MPAPPSLQPSLAENVEQYASRARGLLEAHDFAGAAREGSRCLDILPDLAEVAVLRGNALLIPLVNQAMSDDNTKRFCRQDFKPAWEAFRLARIMDPDNTEAAKELERLGELLERLPDTVIEEVDAGEQHEHSHGNDCGHDDCGHNHSQGHDCAHDHSHGQHSDARTAAGSEPTSDAGYDVIIIGAGAAGVGCAFTLTHMFGLETSRVLLIDRGEAIGASFRMWPAEMRYRLRLSHHT